MRVRLGAAALVVIVVGGSAEAQLYQSSVSCEVADFSMTLRLYLPLAPDGSGSPGAGGMEGTLEIHHQKVPKDRRLWSLGGKRPAQFWNRDGELRMLLMVGPVDDPVTVVIETAQRPGETQHGGRFRLISSEVSLSGRLACNAG